MTRRLPCLLKPAALLVALLVGLPVARADRFHLTSGRVIDGTIVKEDADSITIRTDQGITATLKRSLIKSIETARTPRQIYDAEAGAATTVREHRRWAKFCAEHRFRKEERRHWQAILELDPDHALARDKLGFVRTDEGWQTRADYMKDLGLVEHEGRWMSEPERDMLVIREEAKEQRGKVREALRTAARSEDESEREAARKELASFHDEALLKPFRYALVTASKDERGLAIAELHRRKPGRGFRTLLARNALADPIRKNRKAALEAIAAARAPDTALLFVRALRASSPVLRINATAALMRFPDRRAVPHLIKTLQFRSGGFGRAHAAFLTQRAYIQDFELASGGTGQTIGEVADPVIGGFSTGTVLDVKIHTVEWRSKAKVLQRLTGQSFGTDKAAWARWWRGARDGFELAPEAKARRQDWLATRK